MLKLKEIPIGSWWASAQGVAYGVTVLFRDEEKDEVCILSTKGETKRLHYFKLQTRYCQIIPNEERERSNIICPDCGVSGGLAERSEDWLMLHKIFHCKATDSSTKT